MDLDDIDAALDAQGIDVSVDNTGRPGADYDTIAELLEATSSVPFLLKIDIEGAEADVFSQNTDCFDRFPLIIIELHDWMLPGQANSQAFLRWHAGLDRDFVLAGENVFSVRNPG